MMPESFQMESGVNGKCCFVIACEKINWYVLDSSAGAHGLDHHQWLANSLDRHGDKPALIVTHYPPAFEHEAIEHPFVDSTLGDTDELFEIIVSRKQVKALFVGHWHLWHVAQSHGIHIISLPSVSSSFRPSDPSGWVSVKVQDDGMVLTLNHSNPRSGLHKDHRRDISLQWR